MELLPSEPSSADHRTAGFSAKDWTVLIGGFRLYLLANLSALTEGSVI
jgi:hypothetical protein